MNTLTKRSLCYGAALATVVCTGIASASALGGVFSTDRFGYTGTVTRYDTEADARNAVNATEVVAIEDDGTPDNAHEHRDASFSFVNNASDYGTDQNILMGSWWYTTNTLGQGPGWGNHHGNTGIGFMQLYDADGSTDSSISMDFSNFDGTHWTEFTLSAQGTNATAADDYARFSVYGNVGDGGTYLDYNLNITATGLEGVQTGNIIEANNHPTGVNGTFTGLFMASGGANDGFYAIELAFDTQNWAYDNRNDLTSTYDSFFDSQFVAVHPVPEPTTLSLLGLGLAGMAIRRRRQKA